MKQNYILFITVLFFSQINAQTFTDSNLPIVLITTDDDPATGEKIDIVDEPKVLATMKIIYHTDGSRNYLTEQDNADVLDYNGRIGIEFRGNTSQDLPKKPYGLTTLEEDGDSNNNVEILGMPSENDWVLNSLAYDKSLIRDYLSYSLARELGNYASRGEYCEVVINGEYMGLYIFGEKIKVDSNRVNIEKIEEDDNALPQLSGGYLMQSDRADAKDPLQWSYQTDLGDYVDFIYESPKAEDATATQTAYIKSVFDALSTTAVEKNESITNGYPSIIDIPSFVDFILLNELASNADAYQYSTYYHKDRGGKLRAGPIWDFNLTYGNDLIPRESTRSRIDVWQFDNGDNVGAPFWKDLFESPTFSCYMNRRWTTLTTAGQPLDFNEIVMEIDALVALLAEAKERENTRWGTLYQYDAEISDLKNWLQQRFAWISDNLAGTAACSFPSTPSVVISKINYNPEDADGFDSDELEFIAVTNNSLEAVDLSGIYFKAVGFGYQFEQNSTLAANEELFISSDPDDFESYYGFAPFGEFSRNLSNKSQQLELADAYGTTIDNVIYKNDTPWPSEADGEGAYLVLNDLDADNSAATNWTASTQTLSVKEFADAEVATRVYPNPVNGMVYIQNTSVAIKAVLVYDLVGRVVLKKENVSTRMMLDLSTLASNQYILKILFENNSSVIKKIIKN